MSNALTSPPWTTLGSLICMVTLYADNDNSDDVPPLTRDGDKVIASGTTNPAGDTTLASGIIDADVGTSPDGNPVL